MRLSKQVFSGSAREFPALLATHVTIRLWTVTLLLATPSPLLGQLVFGSSHRVDDGINPQHDEPTVACSPSGRVYAAYAERSEPNLNPEQIRITWSDDRGSTWRWPAIRVNDTTPFSAFHPDLGLAPDGSLLLVWGESYLDADSQIRFSRSTDGARWGPSVVITPPEGGPGGAHPSVLAVASRIEVSYLWREPGGARRAYLTISSDGGETWSQAAPVSNVEIRNISPPAVLAWNSEAAAMGVLLAAVDRQLYIHQHRSRGHLVRAGPSQRRLGHGVCQLRCRQVVPGGVDRTARRHVYKHLLQRERGRCFVHSRSQDQ
jgi:hypothetical protein